MMYVTYQLEDGFKCTYEWHTGSPVRTVRGVAPNVTILYADMDELQYIRKQFTGLPYNQDNRYVEYHGDLAKFVAANM